MDFKDYLENLLLIMKISELPIDDINAEIGFLRLQNIYLYEPCLLYTRENLLRETTKSLSYKRSS